ncbi:MAG: alkaline phosphatase [Candidatus Bathyarchaeia archaeon]
MKNLEKTTKMFLISIVLVCITTSIFAVPALSTNFGSNGRNNIKNVIVLVPDGCSQSIETLARWYKGEPLNIDPIITGSVETWMADSVITDSAPAATAFATGQKSSNGFISVGPKTSNLLTGYTPNAASYVPLATVLEASKLQGKATGLIATSTISHATPAAYAAHNHNRGDEQDIIEQMVYNDVDVVFGGGAAMLFPKNQNYTTSFGANWTGTRNDGENLLDTLTSRGYKFVDSQTSLNALRSGKAWGLFAPSSMQPDMDRTMFAPNEPSLAEMTKKAIQLLSKDRDGFFLMVEGSQVDWADHANDPIYDVTDFLAFDDAVGVALDFAKKDGQTLVMAFPDHNCGGLTIGSYYQDKNAIGHSYTATTIEDVVNPLKGMQVTSTGLAKLVAGKTNAETRDIINQYWSLSLTLDDIEAIKALTVASSKRAAVSLDYAISEYVCQKYTVFGWTTHGHTGEDVPLWAWGPKDSAPVGHYDNTDMAKIAADTLGLSLSRTQSKLYVNVTAAFKPNQWILNTTDPANPVLQFTLNGKTAYLPISKDVMTVQYSNGYTKTFNLEGLVIRAPMINSNQVFVPQQVITILK